jgi:hypothetical protein
MNNINTGTLPTSEMVAMDLLAPSPSVKLKLTLGKGGLSQQHGDRPKYFDATTVKGIFT